MSIGNVRKGVTQASFNEEASFVFFAEILLLSSALGYSFGNWYVFGGLLIGLGIAFMIPILNKILALIFALSWGIIGAIIVKFFQSLESIKDVSIDLILSSFSILTSQVNSIEDISIDLILSLFSTPASQVVGVILFLSGLGLHLSFIEYERDLTDDEDRNF